MSTPTVPVTVTLAAQDGTPYAGVTVRARLDINEVYQGFVISDQADAVTDAGGVAVLNCFPNAPSPTGLGTQGSTYRFWAAIPGGRSLNVEALVPNTACRLENILLTGDDPPSLTDAQLAVLQAQSSVTTVATAAAAAAASASTASGQAGVATAQAGIATTQAGNAAASAASAQAVAAQFGDLDSAVTAAGASATSASGSAATATTQAGIATTQAGLATTARTGAETAQAAAETARDAALASAKIYASTAAGLAGVANGAYFYVPSAASDESLILYLNNAGTAVEQKRYPSIRALSDRKPWELAQARSQLGGYLNARNYISEVPQSAADGQVTYTSAAYNTATGLYTIQPGGSIRWTLLVDFFRDTTAGIRRFAVLQSDPTLTGLAFALLRDSPAPNTSLGTFTETLPGFWESSYTSPPVPTNGARLTITNSGASAISIFLPYGGADVPPVQAYKNFAPVGTSRPVREYRYRFPVNSQASRLAAERLITKAADSVNGSDSNSGTLRSPKLTVAAMGILAADATYGLWRGSVFRSRLPVSDSVNATPGGGVRDIALGRVGKNLPIVSGLDPVANGAWANNGDGTYSYSWFGVDVLLNDGYDNVYAVEIDTTLESSKPLTSQRRMDEVASQAAAAATPGSVYVQDLGSNEWRVTMRPTDSQAPGTRYKYEVVSRKTCADWIPYNRDASLEGVRLAAGCHGYGAIAGPHYFTGDRLCFVFGATHHAVIGGGSVSRSLFYGRGDGDGIALTFYATDTTGLRWRVSDSYFYDVGQTGFYCHNTNGDGAAYESGTMARCSFKFPDLAETASMGGVTGVKTQNLKNLLIEDIYVANAATGVEMKAITAGVLRHSIIRESARPVLITTAGTYLVEHCLIRTRSWSEPSDVNRRGAAVFSGISAATTIRNNLIHARSTDNGGVLTGDKSASVFGRARGVIERNIVILDPTTRSGSDANYLIYDQATPNDFTIDYNLVVLNAPANTFQIDKTVAPRASWSVYQAAGTGKDTNSLLITVGNDPRGLKAVFMDPDRGDYRFAQTELGQKCAEYCRLNNVGPSWSLAAWPDVLPVDDAYASLVDL